MASVELIQAVAVTAELCGRTFSQPAAAVFVADLAAYAEADVIRALAKCRREVRGVLTTQDVVSRIDDGRPGAEEAWAMIPADESQTVVWTSEMAEAYSVCCPLLTAGDKIAARMAFKEAYTRIVSRAKDEARRAEWQVSLGHDIEQRKRALNAAVESGLLTHKVASEAYPAIAPPKDAEEAPALPAPEGSKAKAAEVRKTIQALADMKRNDHIDPLKWAKDLRTSERGGLRLTAAQKAAWREALDQAPAQEVSIGCFTPISNDLLPPGMRA